MVGRVARVAFERFAAVATLAVIAGLVSIAALVIGEGRALAQPADLGIAWDAPASCPDLAALRGRIERRLGHALDDSALGISISIERARGRFVARVDLRALTVANDVRTLTSTRCDELADAVAVVVARVARDLQTRERFGGRPHARRSDAIDTGIGADDRDNDGGRRDAVAGTCVDSDRRGCAGANDRARDTAAHDLAERDNADAPIPPSSRRTPAIAHATTARPARVAAADAATDATVALHAGVNAPPHRVWSLGARLSGVSGIGIVPRVGVGAELAITVRHDSTLAEIAETRWMKSAAQLHAGGPAHVDVDLSVTALRAGWRSEKLPLRGWLSVEGGSMQGSGVSLDNASVGRGRWLAAGAGFGVAWQMTPWIRLVGSTEALVAFERVRFSLGDGVVVYAPSPLSVRTSCGIELGWQ